MVIEACVGAPGARSLFHLGQLRASSLAIFASSTSPSTPLSLYWNERFYGFRGGAIFLPEDGFLHPFLGGHSHYAVPFHAWLVTFHPSPFSLRYLVFSSTLSTSACSSFISCLPMNRQNCLKHSSSSLKLAFASAVSSVPALLLFLPFALLTSAS